MQLGIGVSAYVEVTAGGLFEEYGAIEVNDDGTRHRDRRHVGARPGPRDRVRDDRAGAARHPDGAGDARAVRHRRSCRAAPARWARGRCRSAGARSYRASEEVLAKAKTLAAHLLEANVDDIVLTEGSGSASPAFPRRALSWAELAAARRRTRRGCPPGMEPALAHALDFNQGEATFPFGAHVAVVEVDTETGRVELVRHVAVDDCGRILNPMLVAGQQHGGIAQGVAQALWEGVTYDEDGNPLTANLMDYAMPSAAELPSFEASNTETPTPLNPLGAKGIGESGTIGSTPAVQNAVVDAV